MPISKSGGGFDPTKFTQIALENQMSSATYPAFVTALNVTGKGYLKSAVVSPTTAANAHLKITIDGVLNLWVITPTTVSSAIGLLQNNEIFYDSTKPVIRGPRVNTVTGLNGVPSSYPQTGGVAQNVIISDKIYFQNSLKIEVSSGDGAAVNYRIQGAYQ